MGTLSLRLPNSLHNEVKSLTKKEGISINQFISSAVAEKMSSLLTEEYLLEQSHKGNQQALLVDDDYQTREQAKQSLFEYIEIFYNRQRRHSYLEYLSPNKIEQTNAL